MSTLPISIQYVFDYFTISLFQIVRMRNRGGYKNYRGGGGGGYKGYNRGGKFNNYNKRRRSSFDRDDYQNEEPEAPFESSGAPLGTDQS